MDNLNGKWALVTGASSGFGIEFATLLAEQNANLILAARRTEPMTKLAQQPRQKHNVTVVVEGIDLSVVGAGAELKSRLDRRGITVDVLVNNAGCGLYGNFVDQPLEKIFGMLQLNVLAITELTHIFAADMVARRSGHILLVASMLGYEATPGYAAYAASKGYVLLFGEALRAELKLRALA
jgi:short-subunit dehydrogenase